MTKAMGVESQNLLTQLTMSSSKIFSPFCFRAACFVFVHGFLKLLPMVFYGVGFEPRYWNLFEYSVDCAGSGGRPSDGCDKFSNGRGQSVLVR